MFFSLNIIPSHKSEVSLNMAQPNMQKSYFMDSNSILHKQILLRGDGNIPLYVLQARILIT